MGPGRFQPLDRHAVNDHAAVETVGKQRRVCISVHGAVLNGQSAQLRVFQHLACKQALIPAIVLLSVRPDDGAGAVDDGAVLDDAAGALDENRRRGHLSAHVQGRGILDRHVFHNRVLGSCAVNNAGSHSGRDVGVVKGEVLNGGVVRPGNERKVVNQLTHGFSGVWRENVILVGMHFQPGNTMSVAVQPDIRRSRLIFVAAGAVVADGLPAQTAVVESAALFEIGFLKCDVIGQFEVAVDVSVPTQMGPDVIQIRFGGDHVGRFFRTGGTARPVLAGRNFPCKGGKITDCGDGHACCQQQRQASLESSLFHYVCLLLVSVFVRSQNRMRAPLLCLKLICLIARFSTYRANLFVHSVSIFACNTFFVNEPFFPNTLEFFTRKNCAGEKNRAKPGFVQHFP